MKEMQTEMLVNKDSKIQETLISISAGMPLLKISNPSVELTAQYQCWVDYVGDTFDELLRLRKGKESNNINWMVDIVDAGKSANLLKDLIEITKSVPYEGKEVNMTDNAFIWFSVCPDNHYLARFFTD
tara:strand:+ start:14 stop:397 length:384 start_codon:yes stop_codon:yes gene_type:complete